MASAAAIGWLKQNNPAGAAAAQAFLGGGAYHEGGIVEGKTPPHLKPGEVPAVLQTGELVMRRSAVQAIAQERL